MNKLDKKLKQKFVGFQIQSEKLSGIPTTEGAEVSIQEAKQNVTTRSNNSQQNDGQIEFDGIHAYMNQTNRLYEISLPTEEDRLLPRGRDPLQSIPNNRVIKQPSNLRISGGVPVKYTTKPPARPTPKAAILPHQLVLDEDSINQPASNFLNPLHTRKRSLTNRQFRGMSSFATESDESDQQLPVPNTLSVFALTEKPSGISNTNRSQYLGTQNRGKISLNQSHENEASLQMIMKKERSKQIRVFGTLAAAAASAQMYSMKGYANNNESNSPTQSTALEAKEKQAYLKMILTPSNNTAFLRDANSGILPIASIKWNLICPNLLEQAKLWMSQRNSPASLFTLYTYVSQQSQSESVTQVFFHKIIIPDRLKHGSIIPDYVQEIVRKFYQKIIDMSKKMNEDPNGVTGVKGFEGDSQTDSILQSKIYVEDCNGQSWIIDLAHLFQLEHPETQFYHRLFSKRLPSLYEPRKRSVEDQSQASGLISNGSGSVSLKRNTGGGPQLGGTAANVSTIEQTLLQKSRDKLKNALQERKQRDHLIQQIRSSNAPQIRRVRMLSTQMIYTDITLQQEQETATNILASLSTEIHSGQKNPILVSSQTSKVSNRGISGGNGSGGFSTKRSESYSGRSPLSKAFESFKPIQSPLIAQSQLLKRADFIHNKMHQA